VGAASRPSRAAPPHARTTAGAKTSGGGLDDTQGRDGSPRPRPVARVLQGLPRGGARTCTASCRTAVGRPRGGAASGMKRGGNGGATAIARPYGNEYLHTFPLCTP